MNISQINTVISINYRAGMVSPAAPAAVAAAYVSVMVLIVLSAASPRPASEPNHATEPPLVAIKNGKNGRKL